MKMQEPYRLRQGRYPSKIKPESCLLCQNIAQHFDASAGLDAGENSLLEHRGSLILPNRYPAFPGGSLFLSFDHDAALPGQARIVGNVPTEVELQSLFEIADLFDFVALRNHVRDAMSIPGHDHFHLLPKGIPIFHFFDQIRERSGLGKFYEAEGTPFSLLVVHRNDRAELAAAIHALIANLEAAREVFTSAYYDGYFFLSPRRSNLIQDPRLIIGADAPFHIITPTAVKLLPEMERYMPRRGEFDFSRFLP